jgi:hypothetical protein
MLRALILAILVTGVVAAAACSGSDSNSTAVQPKTEAALKTAARDATKAFLSGDLKSGYNSYARACRDQVSYADFSGGYLFAKTFLEAFMKLKLSDIEVTSVDVSNFGDGKADVLIHTRSKTDPSLSLDSSSDTAKPWAYEDGRWLATDCSDMTIDSNSDATDTPAASSTNAGSTPRPTASGGSPTVTRGPKAAPKIGTPTEIGQSRYTVNAMQDPATPSDKYFAPKAGNRYIAFDVTQEALRDTSYNEYYFQLQDDQSFVYRNPAFGGPEPSFASGEFSAGTKVRGWITFEVPAAAKIVTLQAAPGGAPAAVILDLAQ